MDGEKEIILFPTRITPTCWLIQFMFSYIAISFRIEQNSIFSHQFYSHTQKLVGDHLSEFNHNHFAINSQKKITLHLCDAITGQKLPILVNRFWTLQAMTTTLKQADGAWAPTAKDSLHAFTFAVAEIYHSLPSQSVRPVFYTNHHLQRSCENIRRTGRFTNAFVFWIKMFAKSHGSRIIVKQFSFLTDFNF